MVRRPRSPYPIYQPSFGPSIARSFLPGDGLVTSGGPSGLTIPASLRQLLFHDDGTATEFPAYYTEEEWAGHSHLLKDYSNGVGSLREKRQGYCYDFDGVDDYVVFPNLTSLASLTVEITFEYSSGEQQLFQISTNTHYIAATLNCTRNGNADFVVSSGPLSAVGEIALGKTGGFVSGQFYRLVATTDANGSIISSSIDGVSLSTTAANSRYDGQNKPQHRVGLRQSGSFVFGGKVYDYKVSGFGHYPMQEESGTVCYDISGNGNHGTITNSQAGFHAVDAGVTKSYPNDEGYRESSGVIIPAINSTTAADGNALTYIGRNPNYGLVKSPAWQGNGTSVYVDLGMPVLPTTTDGFKLEFWFKSDTTPPATRVILSQRVDFSASYSFIGISSTGSIVAKLHGLSLNSSNNTYTDGIWRKLTAEIVGTTFILTIGEDVYSTTGALTATANSDATFLARSQDNTLQIDAELSPVSITAGGVTTTYHPLEGTRDVAWIASNGTGGVIVDAVKNGTLETLYTDGDGSWRNPVIEHGGRYDAGVSSDAVLPGRPGTELAVNGLALTIPRNKAPMQLDVNRTGGVANVPGDVDLSIDGLTAESFDTLLLDSNVNKRLANSQYSDRYGAALTDISSNSFFDNDGSVLGVFTAAPPDPTRNNYTGSVGHRFQMVRNATVIALGRFGGSTFNASHQVRLYDDAGTFLGGVTVTPSSKEDELGWHYELLPSPIELVAGTFYRIASSETNGGDNWQDAQTPSADAVGKYDSTLVTNIDPAFRNVVNAFPSTIGSGGSYKSFGWPQMYFRN